MSEVIATIDPEMPRGYDKLSGIEAIRQKDGNVMVNGILELGDEGEEFERRVPSLDPLKMWGYDTDTSDWEKRKADPTGWERDHKMNEMADRLVRVEGLLVRLVEVNASLQRQNEDLRDEVAALRGNGRIVPLHGDVEITPTVEEAIGETSAAPEAPTSDAVAEDSAGAEPEVSAETEVETIVEPAPPEPETASVRPEPTPQPTRIYEPQPSNGPNWRQRLVSRRRVVERRGGGRGAALGVAVIAAIGVGIGAYTLHEVEELEHHQPTSDLIQPNPNHHQYYGGEYRDHEDHERGFQQGSYEQPSSAAPSAVGGMSGYHTEFYKPKGPRLTGIELPKNLKLKGSPGYEYIQDKAGKIVAKKVGWDSQGKIDYTTRHELKKNGYSFDWGKLAQRFKTIVKNG